MLPGFHTRSPLTEHMVNGDQNLSQLFLGNTKSFLLEVYEMYAGLYPLELQQLPDPIENTEYGVQNLCSH